MKITLFSLLLSICFFIAVNAQSRTEQNQSEKAMVRLRVAVVDTTHSNFFHENPGIRRITVLYLENEPYILYLDFRQVDSKKGESAQYDLAFEGDVHAFTSKYGRIDFGIPDISADYKYGKQISRAEYYAIHMEVTHDSTTYYFRPNSSPNWKERQLGAPAKFLGEISELELTLEKSLRNLTYPAGIDSIVVFRGTIGKLAENTIEDMELIVGRRSAFSNLLQSEFEKDDNFWRPAMIDRGPIETKVKIYARLNSDGSITIKTPPRLRTLTGE